MDEDRSPHSDQNQPPAKRQRTLACQRCRQRKQKCEEGRPCSNCTKAGEECLPTRPAPRPNIESSEYVRVLEERIAELESLDPQQSLDHIRAANSAAAADAYEQISPASSAVANGTTHPILVPTATLRRESTHTRTSAISGSSPGKNLGAVEDDDSDQDHLILGLVTSPSAVRDANASMTETSPATHHEILREQEYAPHSLIAKLPLEIEDLLLDSYLSRAQSQYPFFHWDTFLSWHSEWKNCPPTSYKVHAWQGFFVNVVYATSLLLLRRPHVGRANARMFYSNGISLLPAVLEKKDRILQVQAYLLLAMYALHQSSTERIISLASTAMRHCVGQQLHTSQTEPHPVNAEIRLAIQVRRRCFWCAYLLDRLVMFSFDLPPSIPDTMITVRPFANLEDKDLLQVAANTPVDCELYDSPHYTAASSSLHILQCRRIQSEICSITLRADFAEYEHSSEWRIRILAELENYKSRVQKSSDPLSKGYTSHRWLAMIYHYTLLMLYRPTKESVIGPAGDWSVQASTQACLIFRKTQLDRQIAQPWLGLLVQFQSGITLLYCFWATPPEHRTENYDSLDVSDALRACSNILAIMADRWAKADCLRDVFELLAREIPFVDRPARPPTRLSEKAIADIHALLPQVRALIVHRSILRMIDEMISEDFPRSTGTTQVPHSPSVPAALGQSIPSLSNRSNVQTPSANLNFQLPFSAPQQYTFDNMEVQDLDTEGLIVNYPGVFDFDSWG